MTDPQSLLATLAQSSAAIVAIVGGFLVSRLVALSSEREGLRRQIASTRDRLQHVSRSYDEAHSYRYQNSESTFRDWVLEDVVEQVDQLDYEKVLDDNLPRGSSREEMRPVLDALIQRVQEVNIEVRRHLKGGDDTRLRTSDLEARGLKFDETERAMYQQVVDTIAENELPKPRLTAGSGYESLMIPPFRDSALAAGDHSIEMRRLDESIREEQGLAAEKLLPESDLRRLRSDLAVLGRPTGVTSAIGILAAYGLLGIALPVIVMAFDPDRLSGLALTALIGLFLLGLFAVLGYILWYSRTLDDPTD